jgi:hypothetical protein
LLLKIILVCQRQQQQHRLGAKGQYIEIHIYYKILKELKLFDKNYINQKDIQQYLFENIKFITTGFMG